MVQLAIPQKLEIADLANSPVFLKFLSQFNIMGPVTIIREESLGSFVSDQFFHSDSVNGQIPARRDF
jgi:hypothetical protein